MISATHISDSMQCGPLLTINLVDRSMVSRDHLTAILLDGTPFQARFPFRDLVNRPRCQLPDTCNPSTRLFAAKERSGNHVFPIGRTYKGHICSLRSVTFHIGIDIALCLASANFTFSRLSI